MGNPKRHNFPPIILSKSHSLRLRPPLQSPQHHPFRLLRLPPLLRGRPFRHHKHFNGVQGSVHSTLFFIAKKKVSSLWTRRAHKEILQAHPKSNPNFVERRFELRYPRCQSLWLPPFLRRCQVPDWDHSRCFAA